MTMPSLQGFEFRDGRYHVTEQRRSFGKVTGTMMAGLLDKSRWSTPFTTTAKMLRLYNEDISDKKEVTAGVIMEPKILDYIGALHGDDIYSERKGDHAEWKSDFEDDIFGGHIDGLMPDGTVVEVKTTRNIEDWLNGPPIYYWIQASLYAHFLDSERIIFMVGITDDVTLSDPKSWEPTKHTVARYDVPVIDGFKGMMEEARRIYAETVLKGRTTPVTDNPMDARVSSLLGAQLWGEDDLNEAVLQYKDTQARMDAYKETEQRMSEQREVMDMYLRSHGITEARTAHGMIKKTSYTRHTINTDALKRDGLYDVYIKPTVVESIRINKR